MSRTHLLASSNYRRVSLTLFTLLLLLGANSASAEWLLGTRHNQYRYRVHNHCSFHRKYCICYPPYQPLTPNSPSLSAASWRAWMSSMFTPEAIAELEAKLKAEEVRATSNAELTRKKQASAQERASAATAELNLARSSRRAAEAEVLAAQAAAKILEEQINAAKKRNEAAERARDEAKSKLKAVEAEAAPEINAAIGGAREDLRKAGMTPGMQKGSNEPRSGTVTFSDTKSSKNPLNKVSEGLKQTREQAAQALQKAGDGASQAATSLTQKKTYLEWRDKTYSEVDKLGDDYLTKLQKYAITPAERALVPFYIALRDTQRELGNVGKSLSDLGQLGVKAEQRLEHSKEARQAKQEIAVAKETVATEASHVVEQAKTEVGNAVEAVKDAIDALTNQEVILYDITNTLNCSLNLYTGTYFASFDLNFAGLEWNTETTKAMLQGNLVMPEVDPLRLAAASTGSNLSTTNNYDEVRSNVLRDSKARTYFSSERFVKWAGASTAARAVGNAVLGNTRQVFEEAKYQIMLEYSQIYSWLALQELDSIEDACVDALLSVLDGREPTFPGLVAKTSSVRYVYEVSLVGASFLPKIILDQVTERYQQFVNQVRDKAPDDHFAFYLRMINSKPTSDFELLIDNFEQKRLAGEGDSARRMNSVFNKVLNKTNDENIKRILSVIQASSLSEVQASDAIRSRLLDELNIKAEELRQWYVPGNPIIRFENTPVAERLERLLGNLALGNDGSVHVNKFEFDLTTYSVSASVNIRHRHTWGSLRQMLGL